MVEVQNQQAETPDFSTDTYRDAREALKAQIEGLNDQVAAASLKAAWLAQCAADATARQKQREAEAAAAAEQARLDKEADDILGAAEAQEREAVRIEEEKKMRAKFPPVNVGVGLPNELPLDIAPTVLRRLKDVKLVPLYHFTNEGAKAATKDASDLVEDEMYRIMDNSDGVPTFVKGGSRKGLETKIADEDLSWEQFQVATMRFTSALQLAGWPSDRQKMFTEFFYKIQMHPWRTSPDPDGIKDRALFIYAAEQRKLWHQYLELGVNPVPDISQFNDESLRCAKDKAYDRHRSRKDRAADQRVSSRFSF